MKAALEQLIWDRAQHCCEYCQLPQDASYLTFQIDHVVARKHGGKTVAANLALACYYCNSYKGPNLSGVDPATSEVVRLFNPREDRWEQHFEWNGAVLVGRTPRGGATIAVLEINRAEAVALRETLIEEGIFPPFA